MRRKNNKIDLMIEDAMMMKKKMTAVVTVAKIAHMTEGIVRMIEEIVPMIDDGMMTVDTIVEIVHVAHMIEGGEETMMIIADPDTMMMTVTGAIDTDLVQEIDIRLDPILVIAVATDVDYINSNQRATRV